jgi:hypothetical protein
MEELSETASPDETSKTSNSRRTERAHDNSRSDWSLSEQLIELLDPDYDLAVLLVILYAVMVPRSLNHSSTMRKARVHSIVDWTAISHRIAHELNSVVRTHGW